jgi:PTS system nitrogen regulatory IIA component
MNQIASLLPLDNVVANLDASSKKRIFEQVGILFENHQGLARSAVYDALFAREKLGSTGPRAGHRDSPWPHQGAQGAGRRLCAPGQPACPSMRRTASRSA